MIGVQRGVYNTVWLTTRLPDIDDSWLEDINSGINPHLFPNSEKTYNRKGMVGKGEN